DPFAGDGRTQGTGPAAKRTARPKRQRRTGAEGLFESEACARSPWHTGGEISRTAMVSRAPRPAQVIARGAANRCGCQTGDALAVQTVGPPNGIEPVQTPDRNGREQARPARRDAADGAGERPRADANAGHG